MRLQLLLPLLPALALAEGGIQDIFNNIVDRVKEFIPENIPDPIDAGASKVAGQIVERINIRNYERKLSPKLDGEEEWMVYLTGGNKTCFGRCEPVDKAWNESVPILAALASRPSSPALHLGKLDCDKDNVFCTAISAGVPTIWHILVPRKQEPQPRTQIHIVPLNISTTNVGDITSIPSNAKSRYLEFKEYTGSAHPIDGWLAKTGLLVPLGYFLWGIGSTPSWLMMIGISFISRQIMSRRMSGRSMPAAQAGEGPRAPSGAMPPPAARGGSSKGKMAQKKTK